MQRVLPGVGLNCVVCANGHCTLLGSCPHRRAPGRAEQWRPGVEATGVAVADGAPATTRGVWNRVFEDRNGEVEPRLITEVVSLVSSESALLPGICHRGIVLVVQR